VCTATGQHVRNQSVLILQNRLYELSAIDGHVLQVALLSAI
jgi:hypothetical protein